MNTLKDILKRLNHRSTILDYIRQAICFMLNILIFRRVKLGDILKHIYLTYSLTSPKRHYL